MFLTAELFRSSLQAFHQGPTMFKTFIFLSHSLPYNVEPGTEYAINLSLIMRKTAWISKETVMFSNYSDGSGTKRENLDIFKKDY